MKNKFEMIRLKEELGQAIEDGDVDSADRLTLRLLKTQGLEGKKKAPGGFAERICGNGELPRRKKKTKLLLLAAALTILFSLGVVSYASGMFFPQIKNKDGSVTRVNAAQSSNEFKAVQDYNRYLDRLTEAEWEQLADTRENAIYDIPSKVKELCEKYNLKFATKRTELSSYASVKTQLKKLDLLPLLSGKLRKALEQTKEHEIAGYVLDDGNFYLETEMEGEDNRVHLILSIYFTPQGSFPWTGLSSNMGAFDEKNEIDLGQGELGNDFSCVINSEQDEANIFGKVGSYYMTLGISKTLTEDLEQDLKQERARLTKELDQRVRQQTGISDYEALLEKVAAGLEKAAEAEGSALDQAEKEHNWKLKRKLLRKYGNLTETELDVYDECEKKLSEQARQSESLCMITRKDVERVLSMFAFAS